MGLIIGIGLARGVCPTVNGLMRMSTIAKMILVGIDLAAH